MSNAEHLIQRLHWVAHIKLHASTLILQTLTGIFGWKNPVSSRMQRAPFPQKPATENWDTYYEQG